MCAQTLLIWFAKICILLHRIRYVVLLQWIGAHIFTMDSHQHWIGVREKSLPILDGIHHDFRLPGCHPIQQQCHQPGHCWWCGGGSCGRGCLLHAARQEEEDQAWPEAWGVFDAGNGVVFFLEEIRGRGSLWHESTLIWRGEGVMVFGMVAQPLAPVPPFSWLPSLMKLNWERKFWD